MQFYLFIKTKLISFYLFKDLLFVNETSTNCVGMGEPADKLVNFSRLQLLAKCISDITLTDSYRALVSDAGMQAYLRVCNRVEGGS